MLKIRFALNCDKNKGGKKILQAAPQKKTKVEIQEVTASLAAAKEISAEAAVAALSLEEEDIFTLNEEHTAAQKAFLGEKRCFRFTRLALTRVHVSPSHQLKASSSCYPAKLAV